ncbi:MAG: flagellar export chaperone FliS [Syntrophus sp. (in: bacteria)]|nr:flagellar export chaperone FliS [Syntrophus sp. (in: bacteria)]
MPGNRLGNYPKGTYMNPYEAYRNVERSVNLDDTPKVLLKVYQIILEKLEIVKHAIENQNYLVKDRELSKIMTAIEILDSSLDRSYGEIPRNLSSLYVYLIRRLRNIQFSLDIKGIDECKSLLTKINEGFEGAYENEKQKRFSPENKVKTVSGIA